MKFPEKLKLLRQRHSLTQADLGITLNAFSKKIKANIEITEEQVKQWEAGNNTPTIQRAVVISRLFNVSLDELFKEEYKTLNSKISMKLLLEK